MTSPLEILLFERLVATFSACALPALTQLSYSSAACHGDPRPDKLRLHYDWKQKNLLIVRQTVLDRVVLLEACDKYLSTVASVFVSLHSGLS